jgi:hypothetical protein
MTSLKQIEANRRNALKSTGPTTQEGKERSRRSALRHGLTAETVIAALEDAEGYQAFEAGRPTEAEDQGGGCLRSRKPRTPPLPLRVLARMIAQAVLDRLLAPLDHPAHEIVRSVVVDHNFQNRTPINHA